MIFSRVSCGKNTAGNYHFLSSFLVASAIFTSEKWCLNGSKQTS